MTKKFEFLRALSAILDMYDMNISEKTREYCRLALGETLVESLKELRIEYSKETETKITEPQEQPKKRGRKLKQEVEPPKEEVIHDTEEQVVADAAGVPVEEVVEAWEEDHYQQLEVLAPDGEHGLDTRIGRLSLSLDQVSTEDCVNNGFSPLVIANSVEKIGPHPFFKAPLSYISYLPLERMKHYMADALGYQDFEFTDFCDPDTQKDAWKAGIDIEFVATMLTDGDSPILRPASKVVNEPGVAEKIKAAGGFKKITEPLGEDGEKLVKFMARYGINQQLLVDILTIVKKHSENPNPYI